MIYFIHTVIMRFISRTSVFLQKFPWTSLSIDSARPDRKHNKCRCALYVLVSFVAVAWIAV